MVTVRYLQAFLPPPPGAPPAGPVLAPGPLAGFLPAPPGELRIYDPGTQILATARPGSGLLAVGDFAQSAMAGSAMLRISLNGATRSLPAALVDRLAAAPGTGADLWLDGQARASASVTAMMLDGFLVLGSSAGQGLSVYRPGGSGVLAPVASLADAPGRYLGAVGSLVGITSGGQNYVIAASPSEHGLSVLRLGPEGALVQTMALGAAEGLPVGRPSDLAHVRLDGQDFVLLAAQGSSSVTVLRLEAGGKLGFVSQVNDTLDSRFAGVNAIDVLELGGQVLVAAAGRDGGVSVLQLLPDGQLIQRAVFEGHASLGLNAISDVRLVQTAFGIGLYLLVPDGRALLRLALDPGPAGTVGAGPGTAGDDLLIAPPGGASLMGGAGEDVLVDGPGRDTLAGGAGADLFVLRQAAPAGGGADVISGFQPGLDRIDLSSWLGVYSAAALSITARSDGAKISWGSREILLTSVDGKSLAPSAVAAALIFPLQPVAMSPPEADPGSGPAPAELRGGSGNDVLTAVAGTKAIYGGAGDDWISLLPGVVADGGPGTDMLSFLNLTQPVDVRLARQEAVSGGQTMRFEGFENITGTIYGDYLEGDAGNNSLRGLGDWDWFVASGGADLYDGGMGRDMVSYIYAPAPVTVDLADPSRNRGLAEGDRFVSVERVTGSSFNDNFRGSAEEEDFRGMGGDDWFVGSDGRDRYDGGAGRDTVAYSSARAAVEASLLLGRGTKGQAARDLYTSIENLTGSPYGDVLTGDHNRNVLRGLVGDDTLIGNGGNDWLYGGAGNDRIDGGSGWDVAFYERPRAQYLITTSGAVTSVRWLGSGAGEGTDSLISVEVLRFADGDYLL